MSGAQALHAALALARTPQLAGAMRAQPLPPGVVVLLRVVAGERDVLEEAARSVDRPPPEIVEAATLYIQKVMLYATAPAERVLGVAPGADRAEARAHMRLLMLWLHPDKSSSDWRAAFAGKVLASWRAFSMGEPGAEPSGALVKSRPPMKGRSTRPTGRPRRSLRLPWVAVPIERTRRPWRLRAAIALAAVAVVALVLVSSDAPARLVASWMDDDGPSRTASNPAPHQPLGSEVFGTRADTMVLPAASHAADAEPAR